MHPPKLQQSLCIIGSEAPLRLEVLLNLLHDFRAQINGVSLFSLLWLLLNGGALLSSVGRRLEGWLGMESLFSSVLYLLRVILGDVWEALVARLHEVHLRLS